MVAKMYFGLDMVHGMLGLMVQVSRQLIGHNWSPITWRKVTGQAPPDALQSFCSRKEKKHISSMKSKLKPDVRSRAYKRKRGTDSVASSKKARSEYGKDCRDCEEDVSGDIFKKRCDAFFSNEVILNWKKMAEKSTRKQSSCEEWHDERKKRITSSNFGKIVKLRPSTSVTSTVKSLLGQKYLSLVSQANFFQKLMRQGGFMFYFLLNEGFYFFPAKV